MKNFGFRSSRSGKQDSSRNTGNGRDSDKGPPDLEVSQSVDVPSKARSKLAVCALTIIELCKSRLVLGLIIAILVGRGLISNDQLSILVDHIR